MEKVTTGCDEPLTQRQQPDRSHTDHALNDPVPCKRIIALFNIIQGVVRGVAAAATLQPAAAGAGTAGTVPAATAAAAALAAVLAARGPAAQLD